MVPLSKITVFAGLVVAGFLFFLFGPTTTLAACNEFYVDPRGTQPQGTILTVQARNCTFYDDASKYEFRLYQGATQLIGVYAPQYLGHGLYVSAVTNLSPGSYNVRLTEEGREIQGDTFTVSDRSDDDSGDDGSSDGGIDDEVLSPSNRSEETREGCPSTHISTAIGCIPFSDTATMTTFFLRWAVGIAGGIALFMVGLASFRITTSQGDPRRLQGGQELLMSAIGGLLMIVLSVFLLRFIGVNLLGLF